MTAPPVVSRLFTRLFRVLDSEGVVFFQCIVYVHTAAMGASNRFGFEGLPPVLSDGLAAMYAAWPWLCMGTLICLFGKYLCSNPATTRYWVYTTGLICQFVGDVCAMGAFAAYVISTVQEHTPGKPVAAAWWAAALAWCAFFLCWRDIRRYFQAEKAIRQ